MHYRYQGFYIKIGFPLLRRVCLWRGGSVSTSRRKAMSLQPWVLSARRDGSVAREGSPPFSSHRLHLDSVKG